MALQGLPRLLGVFAKDYDVVLALIEIETQTRFDVTFTLTIDRAGDVIDVHDHSAALGMGEFDEFHRSSLLCGVRRPDAAFLLWELDQDQSGVRPPRSKTC